MPAKKTNKLFSQVKLERYLTMMQTLSRIRYIDPRFYVLRFYVHFFFKVKFLMSNQFKTCSLYYDDL